MQYYGPFEIDFPNEIQNAIKLRKLFEGDKDVEIPDIKSKYCSARVITMDFIRGFPITNLSEIKKYKLSKR